MSAKSTVVFEKNAVSNAKYVFLGEGALLLGDCDLVLDADDDVSCRR